ncbi:hypothetical protein GOBAR_DD12800 [Gossypium barbadense]|nr:hypothetical protein GOBAR_DD12800 [Gossypium barbadense]
MVRAKKSLLVFPTVRSFSWYHDKTVTDSFYFTSLWSSPTSSFAQRKHRGQSFVPCTASSGNCLCASGCSVSRRLPDFYLLPCEQKGRGPYLKTEGMTSLQPKLFVLYRCQAVTTAPSGYTPVHFLPEFRVTQLFLLVIISTTHQLCVYFPASRIPTNVVLLLGFRFPPSVLFSHPLSPTTSKKFLPLLTRTVIAAEMRPPLPKELCLRYVTVLFISFLVRVVCSSVSQSMLPLFCKEPPKGKITSWVNGRPGLLRKATKQAGPVFFILTLPSKPNGCEN